MTAEAYLCIACSRCVNVVGVFFVKTIAGSRFLLPITGNDAR